MELSGTLAAWDGPRLAVWDATQGVVNTRDCLASAFGLKPADVRVLCPFVGGGFGGKGAVWPHTILAAVAAGWSADRSSWSCPASRCSPTAATARSCRRP